MNISDCDAVILCGGQGTRIKNMLPVGQPKALADINGKPFLQLLLSQLRGSGFKRFVFCAGYGALKIRQWLTDFPFGVGETFQVFEEPQPLGTGGALRSIFNSKVQLSEIFFVFNGDTINFSIWYQRALEAHFSFGRTPLISALRYRNQNSGVYIMHNEIRLSFEWEQREKFNIEDLPFHTVISFIEVPHPFLDIGIPAGLTRAREIFK